MWEYQFRRPFFVKKKILTSISEPLYFLKSCPIFEKLVLLVFSKYNGFLWVYWFLAKTLPSIKIPQPNYSRRFEGEGFASIISFKFRVPRFRQPWMWSSCAICCIYVLHFIKFESLKIKVLLHQAFITNH